MEEQKEDKDLKQENSEDVKEEESASEESSSEETPLKNTEEEEKVEEPSKDEQVEEMLADGTPAQKKITIKKEKYDELAEKSELYEKFTPLLSKLNENPEVVEKIMGGEGKETIEERVKRIEDKDKENKRIELRNSLSRAVDVWPDFRNHWNQIQPIMASLEKQGVSISEAIQRAYYAVNPDAAAKEQRLVQEGQNQEAQNKLGINSSSAGSASKTVHQDTEIQVSDEDREFARLAGIPLELYKKHQKHIEPFKDL